MATIDSMTGFGRAQQATALGTLSVELRTVNNRFQDLTLSLPRELASQEAALRAKLLAAVPRGKIDARVRLSAPAAALQPQVRLNLDLARRYLEELRPLQALGVSAEVPLQALTSLPGVVELTPPELDDAVLWGAVDGVVREALDSLRQSRAQEGGALAEALLALAAQLVECVERVEARQGEILERWRVRLGERLEELARTHQVQVEPGRVAMEVALLADRSDVAEELTRLRVHTDQFRTLLTKPDGEPLGKRLDFLMQEMHREVNTLGSKCRDTAALGETLTMKSVVERMREQVQNIQ